MATDSTPEKEWAGEGEEQLSEEVEGGSGLETKRQRRINANKEISVEAAEAADELRSNGEDSRSVYFDEDEGVKDFNSDSSTSRSTEEDSSVSEKKLENGNSAYMTALDDLQSVPEAGAKQDPNHIKTGNGLNSYIASVDIGADEIVVAADPETRSHLHNEIAKVVKLDASELDLERVLEEQETHDLFCPNCNSCITKRVILRKRKRRVPDFQHEERPGKLHIKPNIVAPPVEFLETSHENEPDVFRCLSCFSFFTQTENGFNIFRIFRKREQSVNLQVPNVLSSGQTFTRDVSFSISTAESSKVKGNEAAPLPPLLEVSFGGEESKNISSLPISISSRTEEIYATIGKTKSGLGTDTTISLAATQFPVKGGDQSLNQNNRAPVPPVSEAANAGGGYATNLDIISGGGVIKPVIISKPAISGVIVHNNHDVVQMPSATIVLPQDDAVIKPIGIIEPSSHGTFQKDPIISISAPPSAVFIPSDDVQINVENLVPGETRRENEWEVLKSVVYGGLIESITSLGVVSSAAGSATSTLNIVAIGLANLIGGFIVILHDLSELKSSAATNQNDEPTGRYWKILGRKSNFGLHATVAIASYILFGLLPPVIYGFSFRESDEKDYKLIAVAASSLLCIALLAVGKAHVNEPRSYIKTSFYYLGLGFAVSGLSYVAGMMIDRFMEQLGLFEQNTPLPAPPAPPFLNLFGAGTGLSSWAAV